MSADVAVARHGAVAAVGLQRPAKKNALTAAMYEALAEAVGAAEADHDVRAILFHGTPEVFTAGNDLNDFLARPPGGEDAPVFRFLRAVSGAAKPLVAAVNGPAVGIGTTLLLHCDLVYAGEDARFQLPFTRLGLVPEFASTYMLPFIAGYQRAAELLLLAYARRNRNTGASSPEGGRARKSLRSLPAVKASGVPWKRMARTSRSASAAATASASASYIAAVRAFFFAGRTKPSVATAPRRPTAISALNRAAAARGSCR